MTIRTLLFSLAVALLLASARAEAGKIPLTPEQLLAESKLIVTGQSQSHREEDSAGSDGSITRFVYLNVKVETVIKGDAKPGDVIPVVCWVMVQEPRDGVVWDAGHHNIPGDGGRAKFFLDQNTKGTWSVIYPNGLERLDEIPPLTYKREPAPKSPETASPPGADPPWILFIVSAGLLVFIAAVVLFVSRRTTPST